MNRKKYILPILVLIMVLVAGLLMGGCGMLRQWKVGKNISMDKVQDFYYTLSSSVNPPEFQRYRFYVEDGKWIFYHETREGEVWPLTEDYITVSGLKELTEQEQAAFIDCINGGIVTPRTQSFAAGGTSISLYLYWKGDKGKNQVFKFSDDAAMDKFLQLCTELATE